MQSVEPPSSRAEELKTKGSEAGGDGDSMPVEEALALSLQGVASVSSCILPCLILT